MKKIFNILIFTLTIVLVFTVSNSFAGIRIQEAKTDEVKGTFNLILYGARHLNDLETIAILYPEGGRYTIEPYAPEFDYTVKKGVPAKEALKEAEGFVSGNPDFRSSQLSRIVDDKGNIFGYEVRPLYMPFVYGVFDVLDVGYSIKGNKVIVTIRLSPLVEKKINNGDGTKEDSM